MSSPNPSPAPNYSGDPDGLAAYAYSIGVDPIDHAVQIAQINLDVYITVCAARYENPAAFPGYDPEPRIEKTARRIVGELLDAGWTPPVIAQQDTNRKETP